MINNKFNKGLSFKNLAEACVMVIFGANGDLTHRKLIPALYNLALDGDLPPGLLVVGYSRMKLSDEEFRESLREANIKHSRQSHQDKIWNSLSERIFYQVGDFNIKDDFAKLRDRLETLQKTGASKNLLFYMAAAPGFFDKILEGLQYAKLNVSSKKKAWNRVIIEKPFGRDLNSAKELNEMIRSAFREEDTYRIDHYLGKETAQNIMALRFANAIFEHLWNSRYIDHVQITCAENLGMERGRGGYYDKSGALRDMVQNHLLQLLSLIAMEPPTDLSADRVRDEKVKVLRSLRPITPQTLADNVVRGQYVKGSLKGKEVDGYLDEDKVAKDSKTETYVALKVNIDNWRWAGVPFFIRMGKQLPKKATEISVHFTDPPSVLFQRDAPKSNSKSLNVLVIRIQPDEGISLRIMAKTPGTLSRLDSVKMDFRYSSSFGKNSPEAYERLLLDSMAGDPTLFARGDEVEAAWRFIDTIEEAWHNEDKFLKKGEEPEMANYVAGSWGPKEADVLLNKYNRQWRRM